MGQDVTGTGVAGQGAAGQGATSAGATGQPEDVAAAKSAAERRWEVAFAASRGRFDPADLRRRNRRLAIGIVVGTALVMIAAAVVGYLAVSAFGSGPAEPVPAWRRVVGVVVLAAAIATMIGAFIWAAASRRVVSAPRSVAAQLHRQERRHIMRQINGKAEVDPATLPVALAIAEQSRGSILFLVPLQISIALIQLSSFLSNPDGWLRIVNLTLVVLIAAVVLPLLAFQLRRYARFIREHRDREHRSPEHRNSETRSPECWSREPR